MEIALIHPQIPPNTGNVARLCAAIGASLHLVEPLGFEISDRRLKRAGLDYWDFVEIVRHPSLQDFLDWAGARRLDFFSKKAERSYIQARFAEDGVLVFGSETSGLPNELAQMFPEHFWRIPILQTHVRSLNLASAVAVVAYEALRQTGRLIN